MPSTTITLPKSYVALRCRDIIGKIEARRKELKRELFNARVAEYYNPRPFPLNVVQTVKRVWNNWPPEPPESTDDDVEDFMTNHVDPVQRDTIANLFSNQQHLCTVLLRAATTFEADVSTLNVSLSDYQYFCERDEEKVAAEVEVTS